MLITVFTPTYNRAHLLPRLYESLCQQTCTDFEWLIVDDGSTDGTESLIQNFELRIKNSAQCGNEATPAQSQLEGEHNSNFPFRGAGGIRYIKQPNGGKHRAINRGVKEARGELFFIVDSDDSLPCNAVEIITQQWGNVKDDLSFGGLAGFIAHHDGTVIGHGNNDEILDCTSLELRYKYHVTGDMAEVFRTNVLKDNSFPEIDGERFCPEDLIWNRIAQKYRLRVFHSVIYYRDYLSGGLTDRIVRIRMESPVATVITYQELNSYDIPFMQKVKAAINYWRFRECVPRGKNIPKLPWHWFWCQPIGMLMHHRDISHG